MAQAFQTTYEKYFRWHPIERRKNMRPVDRLAETAPEGDMWYVRKALGQNEEDKETLAVAKATIRRMYKKRLWTSYQRDFCKDKKPVDEEVEEANFENELLEYCKQMYGMRVKQIPPPLPTAKRLYGYIRPTRMYTPLSTYQNGISRMGYRVLDRNAKLERSAKNHNLLNSADPVSNDTTKKSKELVKDLLAGTLDLKNGQKGSGGKADNHEEIDQIWRSVCNHPPRCNCCNCSKCRN